MCLFICSAVTLQLWLLNKGKSQNIEIHTNINNTMLELNDSIIMGFLPSIFSTYIAAKIWASFTLGATFLLYQCLPLFTLKQQYGFPQRSLELGACSFSVSSRTIAFSLLYTHTYTRIHAHTHAHKLTRSCRDECCVPSWGPFTH